MKRRECRRQRIKGLISRRFLKRDKGNAEWLMGMFFLLLLAILLCMQLEISLYATAGASLEDALAASNLASAIVDLEEYGTTHVVRIPDVRTAYERYRQAVQGNLGLDEDWEASGLGVIAGRVRVVKYSIYNVTEENVTVWDMDEEGGVTVRQEHLGSVYAPSGQKIEHTSVYSEIAFPVRGLFGMETEAHKGKLVDIVAAAE